MIDPDARILILGGGIVGLLWSALFKHQGHMDITLSETSSHRRSIAQKSGKTPPTRKTFSLIPIKSFSYLPWQLLFSQQRFNVQERCFVNIGLGTMFLRF